MCYGSLLPISGSITSPFWLGFSTTDKAVAVYDLSEIEKLPKNKEQTLHPAN